MPLLNAKREQERGPKGTIGILSRNLGDFRMMEIFGNRLGRLSLQEELQIRT